jgi:hypothetical protein
LIEIARTLLLAGRHGELHVFDSDYWHARTIGG